MTLKVTKFGTITVDNLNNLEVKGFNFSGDGKSAFTEVDAVDAIIDFLNIRKIYMRKKYIYKK